MIKKLAALLAFLQAITLNLHAATPKPLPTNFVQTISLQLTAVGPGPIAPSGLSGGVITKTLVTKDAIQAIGAASGMNFSSKAQLVCATAIYYESFPKSTTNAGKIFTTSVTNGYLSTPAFQIRDGATIIDVTSFINPVTLNSNTYITSYKRDPQYRYSQFTNYRVRTIAVTNSAISFTGQGFVTSPLVPVTAAPGIVIFGNNDNWTDFTGFATQGALTGVLQGTIKATYNHVE